MSLKQIAGAIALSMTAPVISRQMRKEPVRTSSMLDLLPYAILGMILGLWLAVLL